MAGSLNKTIFKDMNQFLQDTKHNKIQHGLQVGMAMLVYEQAEKADEWIETLLKCKTNVALRHAGIWMLAMAYVGNGKPKIIKCLLDILINDPNPDSKRIAATSLGFILCK